MKKMRKLALGIAVILLIALAMPVLADSRGLPNDNSYGSVAWIAGACGPGPYVGYSNVGACMKAKEYYWPGLAEYAPPHYT